MSLESPQEFNEVEQQVESPSPQGEGSKKKRKTRSDKNKKRKLPFRELALLQNSGYIDQKLLLFIQKDVDDPSLMNDIVFPEAPKFSHRLDYFKEYFKMYLQNENLLADIDQISNETNRMERKIFSITDFYDNTLIPQIITQPHKFLHRLKQQQFQLQQQKIL